MIVAELTVIPVGMGSSMEDTLEKVERALKDANLDHSVGPLGTTLEATDMKDILDATRRAHEAIKGTVPRVVIELRIDHRMDKEETKESLSELKA